MPGIGQMQSFRRSFAPAVPGGAYDTTYWPNSTGCDGWVGWDDDAPPTARALDNEVAYSDPGDRNTVSLDDSNYVASALAAYVNNGHHLVYTITQDEGDVTDIAITVKGCDLVDGTVGSLFLWNHTTSSYGAALDSNSGTSKYTLTHTQSANLTDYIDGSGEIHVMFQTSEELTAEADLYFAKIVVTAAGSAPG